jgi:TolB protein
MAVAFAGVVADDGQIAYQSNRSRGENIYLLDVRTRVNISVTRDRALYNAMPAWSPDGQQIAYTMNIGENLDASSIYVMNADGTRLRRVTYQNSILAAWSPDGAHIAYTMLGNVVAMVPSVGGVARRLGRGNGADWSPDSSAIVFLGRDNANTESDGTQMLQIVQVDSRQRRNLLPETLLAYAPDWSPDGQWIAFISPVGGDNRLYLVEAGCRRDCEVQMQPLSDSLPAASEPDWSPDGARLAFACGQPRRRTEICIVNADGTGLQQLTASAPYVINRAPAWRP